MNILPLLRCHNGGSCTGEQVADFGKAKSQQKEHSPVYDVMKKINEMLDLNHILNPSKVFCLTPRFIRGLPRSKKAAVFQYRLLPGIFLPGWGKRLYPRAVIHIP